MNRKAVVRVVSVGNIFAKLASLHRTASHWEWGRVIGISSHDQLVLQLVSGTRMAFDVRTGLAEAEK